MIKSVLNLYDLQELSDLAAVLSKDAKRANDEQLRQAAVLVSAVAKDIADARRRER